MAGTVDRGDALRLDYVTVDAQDPERLAAFWGAVLGVGAEERDGPYLPLARLPNGVSLMFQEVPEPKRVKDRLHVDVRTRDLGAAFERVLALGGRHLADVEWWRVMADPEGNEFCLEPPRPDRDVTAERLRAVGIDCGDPERLAAFWGALLGRGIARRSGPYLMLETPPGGLDIYFQQVPEPKTGKNRVHLDLRPRDPDATFERVLALGGHHLADVETWWVMADPDGNEFCLLRELGEG
jgi:predicted enzyme related to lactoylglutathione lyase